MISLAVVLSCFSLSLSFPLLSAQSKRTRIHGCSVGTLRLWQREQVINEEKRVKEKEGERMEDADMRNMPMYMPMRRRAFDA